MDSYRPLSHEEEMALSYQHELVYDEFSAPDAIALQPDVSSIILQCRKKDMMPVVGVFLALNAKGWRVQRTPGSNLHCGIFALWHSFEALAKHRGWRIQVKFDDLYDYLAGTSRREYWRHNIDNFDKVHPDFSNPSNYLPRGYLWMDQIDDAALWLGERCNLVPEKRIRVIYLFQNGSKTEEQEGEPKYVYDSVHYLCEGRYKTPFEPNEEYLFIHFSRAAEHYSALAPSQVSLPKTQEYLTRLETMDEELERTPESEQRKANLPDQKHLAWWSGRWNKHPNQGAMSPAWSTIPNWEDGNRLFGFKPKASNLKKHVSMFKTQVDAEELAENSHKNSREPRSTKNWGLMTPLNDFFTTVVSSGWYLTGGPVSPEKLPVRRYEIELAKIDAQGGAKKGRVSTDNGESSDRKQSRPSKKRQRNEFDRSDEESTFAGRGDRSGDHRAHPTGAGFRWTDRNQSQSQMLPSYEPLAGSPSPRYATHTGPYYQPLSSQQAYDRPTLPAFAESYSAHQSRAESYSAHQQSRAIVAPFHNPSATARRQWPVSGLTQHENDRLYTSEGLPLHFSPSGIPITRTGLTAPLEYEVPMRMANGDLLYFRVGHAYLEAKDRIRSPEDQLRFDHNSIIAARNTRALVGDNGPRQDSTRGTPAPNTPPSTGTAPEAAATAAAVSPTPPVAADKIATDIEGSQEALEHAEAARVRVEEQHKQEMEVSEKEGSEKENKDKE